MAAFALLALASCKKEYDVPPIPTIPTGNIITLDSLRNMFQGLPVRFTTDVSVYGVITADEVDGNLYKNVFVQSGSAAINMRLLNSGGVYIGDSIRIYLKGTVLSKYNGMLQLDSVDVDKNVIKQATGVEVAPLDVTIPEINTGLQGRLIRINDVEFVGEELSKTYADAILQVTENRTLTDCSGNTAIIRTSGYANYAAQPIAQGHGSVVAVVSEFNGTVQLYIRKLAEVNMNGPRCTGGAPILSKNFEDNSVTSGGWTTFTNDAAANWITGSTGVHTSGGTRYVKCTGYYGGADHNVESWLISPSFSLASAVNPALTFINAYNYSGLNIEVKVSTNYTSGDPNMASWTTLAPVLSTGGWNWVNSGNVSLSGFNGQGNVHVAIKYTSTTSGSSTWEVDNIKVFEQ